MTTATRYKVCPACRTENAPNAADCEKCGNDILAEPVERRASEAPPVETAPRPDLSRPHITLESLAVAGRTFTVYEGQTVGRSDQSDVTIEDIPDLDSISRRMAKFHRRGDQWFVQHIANTNYIAVDGEQYEEDDDIAIHDGSVLGLALCSFFVRVGG